MNVIIITLLLDLAWFIKDYQETINKIMWNTDILGSLGFYAINIFAICYLVKIIIEKKKKKS